MKFVPEDTQVILREVPDEISLGINLSNCPHRCPGCHSPYLQGNVGEELTFDTLSELIDKNVGISCICFFGGDSVKYELCDLFLKIRKSYPEIKIALYSGDEEINHTVARYVDYYKIGPYIEDRGPLDSKDTNQRMYIVNHDENEDIEDITYKFWNKNF